MGTLKGVRGGVLLVALAASPGACSDDEPAPAGSGDEGQACYPNDTCNAGLVCDEGRCVEDGEEGGSGNSSMAGSRATSSGGEGGSSSAGTPPGGGSAGEGGNNAVSMAGAGGEGGSAPVEPVEPRPMPNPVLSGLPNPASYDTATEGVVIDEVTGLVWQSEVVGADVFGVQADAVAYCENMERASFSDWRLPSRLELVSIVDYHDESPPLINQAAFPQTGSPTTWTSTVYPDEPAGAWKVSFLNGLVTWQEPIPARVRCVRGEPWAVSLSEGAGALTGTVADATTGLTWEQAGSPVLRDWQQANTYCVTLELGGSTDWRLPSVNELQSIVDDAKTEDMTFDVFFDDPAIVDANIEYWTSTPWPNSPTQTMTVQFLTGQPSTAGETTTKRTRCVRP